jgi:hypothetical protein
MVWRRLRGSNPRGSCPPTRFPGVCLRPLGQASAGQSSRVGLSGAAGVPGSETDAVGGPRGRGPGVGVGAPHPVEHGVGLLVDQAGEQLLGEPEDQRPGEDLRGGWPRTAMPAASRAMSWALASTTLRKLRTLSCSRSAAELAPRTALTIRPRSGSGSALRTSGAGSPPRRCGPAAGPTPPRRTAGRCPRTPAGGDP